MGDGSRVEARMDWIGERSLSGMLLARSLVCAIYFLSLFSISVGGLNLFSIYVIFPLNMSHFFCK